MKRAKTITGLLWQNITLRWNGISKRGRTLLIVGFVLASAVALQFGACMFGACPGSASPCSSSPCDVPCNVDAASDDDEPCPYAAAAAAEAEAEAEAEQAEDGDVPPCHAR